MSHLEPIDTEMTPMRSAIRDRQVELGIGASTGCFHCEEFDKSCYPSIVKERGEVEVIKGDWTYVGQQYGQAMIAGKYAKILFVSMERPLPKPEEFEETQYQFRTACFERSNPHMGGTDVELKYLLDPTPCEQRCRQFALTNSVRCRPFSSNSKSQSTSTMKAKCQAHTKAIVEILTPDIIVTQGRDPSDSIIKLFDPEVVFKSDNGGHSQSLRKAEVRHGGGVLFLLTEHPAIRPHRGFRWKSGGLPDYLCAAINEVRDLYAADSGEKSVPKSRQAKQIGPAPKLDPAANQTQRVADRSHPSKDLDRITINPKVCLGQPTVRGMRITISVILKMLAGGKSVAEVLEAYPELEEEDVLQSIRYAKIRGVGRL